MKRVLSIVVALGIAVSLLAGAGVRSVEAAVTLTVTPSGNFVGGIDARGVTPVDGACIVASITDSTHAVVDVTRVGAGAFGTVPNVSVFRTTSATSTDPHWAASGDQWISFAGGYTFVPGDRIAVTAATRNGAGTIISCNTPTTLAKVHVTAAAVGAISPAVRKAVGVTSSTDLAWEVTGNHTIVFTTTAGLHALDVLEISMVQASPAVPAAAFLIVGGVATAGNVASATWQDTTGASHTASYTVVTGDTITTVTTRLKHAINAVAGGNVIAVNASTSAIMLTQTVAGAVGNGRKLGTGTTAIAPALTIRTLGGLTSPILVEKGKSVQLVAVDRTGAVVTAVWTSSLPAIASISPGGLVMGVRDSGISLVTASSGPYSGSLVVIPILPQTITGLAVGLVPTRVRVAGRQQFSAIATSKAYAGLDYTTRAVWKDTLHIAAISNVAPAQGLLTYSAAETGTVSARAAGLTTTVTVKINAAGAVTIAAIPVVVKNEKVVVLTIGSSIATVSGHARTIEAAPEIVNGHTFVPIRFIAETFGAIVGWLPENKGITMTLGDTTIGLQIGTAIAVINKDVVALDAAPYIRNSRMMVPLRVVSRSFGSDVTWNAARRTITITRLLP